MKTPLLISACLIGNNTKYNGKNNYNEKTKLLEKYCDFIIICPEMDGGLPCPRDPSEIQNDKVISSSLNDVTKEYVKGANIALELAKKHNCKYALLKEKSPSCGTKFIYDGSFTKTKIKGMGITARLLYDNNIKLYNEDEIDLLINDLKLRK